MHRISLLFCLLLLTACSGSMQLGLPSIRASVTSNPSTPQTSATFTPEGSHPSVLVAVPTTHPSFTPSGQVPSPPSYTLQVVLNYTLHRLEVNEAISYQNTTGQTLTDLVLAVEPNLWEGCFKMDSLTVGDENVAVNLNQDRLELQLATPLVPGKIASLSLRYSLDLPAADSHHVFGYNNLQVNLVDWYPFIVPFSGAWLMHPPANVGEHLGYDQADFDVTVTFTDPTLPITVAASAAVDSTAGIWHYILPNARTFVFSASTAYQSSKTNTDGVTITSYYFDNDKTPGRAVLGEVSKAMTTYTSLFGPSPHRSLSIVESPFFDGLEYDGLFFLSRDFYKEDDGTVLNNLVDIAVHETAHQWWFGSVGNDQALEPWLDEAMATYSERLFYEKNYPEVTSWWNFRVDAYAPSGWVDEDIYHSGGFRTYANAVYLRGAQFLEALRRRVGDEAFFAFLKDYATQMAGRRATADDFFRVLRQCTPVDFADIQRAFFQRIH